MSGNRFQTLWWYLSIDGIINTTKNDFLKHSLYGLSRPERKCLLTTTTTTTTTKIYFLILSIRLFQLHFETEQLILCLKLINTIVGISLIQWWIKPILNSLKYTKIWKSNGNMNQCKPAKYETFLRWHMQLAAKTYITTDPKLLISMKVKLKEDENTLLSCCIQRPKGVLLAC